MSLASEELGRSVNQQLADIAKAKGIRTQLHLLKFLGVKAGSDFEAWLDALKVVKRAYANRAQDPAATPATKLCQILADQFRTEERWQALLFRLAEIYLRPQLEELKELDDQSLVAGWLKLHVAKIETLMGCPRSDLLVEDLLGRAGLASDEDQNGESEAERLAAERLEVERRKTERFEAERKKAEQQQEEARLKEELRRREEARLNEPVANLEIVAGRWRVKVAGATDDGLTLDLDDSGSLAASWIQPVSGMQFPISLKGVWQFEHISKTLNLDYTITKRAPTNVPFLSLLNAFAHRFPTERRILTLRLTAESSSGYRALGTDGREWTIVAM